MWAVLSFLRFFPNIIVPSAPVRKDHGPPFLEVDIFVIFPHIYCIDLNGHVCKPKDLLAHSPLFPASLLDALVWAGDEKATKAHWDAFQICGN